MPRLSTPRMVPTPSVIFLPGIQLPGGENTPFMPVRAFGAPHTTCTGSPEPVSTMQTRRRSAFGMLLRLDHARDRERRERLRLVVDVLDFQSDHRELVGELFQRLVGVEMLLQPGEGELHVLSPPAGSRHVERADSRS